MKKILLPLIVLATCIVFCNCSNDDEGGGTPIIAKTRVDIPLTESGKLVNAGIQQFSLKMFGIIPSIEHEIIGNGIQYEGNYVISPLGVSYMLGMLENGAKGETYDIIANGLALSGCSLSEINDYFYIMTHSLTDVDNTSTFICANSIWIADDEAFKPDYVERVNSAFNATLKSGVGYGTRKNIELINQWVYESTNGLINEFSKADTLSPYLTHDNIINAVYFKGRWSAPFKQNETRKEKFTTYENKEVEVDMMNQTGSYIAAVDDKMQLVTLPYGNGAFQMTFFMPTNKNDNVDTLIAHISEIWTTLKTYPYVVNLSIPKFEIDFSATFETLLNSMGMDILHKQSYEEVPQPDYSGIREDGECVAFEQPLQGVNLKIDEEGTEAAVATATNDGTLKYIDSGPKNDKEIRINFNRPFGFMISEISTGAILFAGKICDPTKMQINYKTTK